MLVFVSYPISYNKSVISGQNPYGSKAVTAFVRPQNTNLNQNYQSYKILRGRIIDKVQELLVTLDNPNSSINRFIKELRGKYGAYHTNKISQIIDKIYFSSDQVLASDTVDSYEYFDNMKHFTKNMNNLLSEISPYLSSSDAIDELNPAEANHNLMRFVNDFAVLDKAESNFPRAFRNSYVSENQKK